MSTAQILLIAGSGLLTFLGLAHGLMILSDIRNPRFFAPKDKREIEVLKGMRELGMHAKQYGENVNMWRAWIGFNISHSIGVLVIAGGTLTLAINHFALYAAMPVFHWGVPVITTTYLITSIFFWFPSPTRAIGTALALVGASTAMIVT